MQVSRRIKETQRAALYMNYIYVYVICELYNASYPTENTYIDETSRNFYSLIEQVK